MTDLNAEEIARRALAEILSIIADQIGQAFMNCEYEKAFILTNSLKKRAEMMLVLAFRHMDITRALELLEKGEQERFNNSVELWSQANPELKKLLDEHLDKEVLPSADIPGMLIKMTHEPKAEE